MQNAQVSSCSEAQSTPKSEQNQSPLLPPRAGNALNAPSWHPHSSVPSGGSPLEPRVLVTGGSEVGMQESGQWG